MVPDTRVPETDVTENLISARGVQMEFSKPTDNWDNVDNISLVSVISSPETTNPHNKGTNTSSMEVPQAGMTTSDGQMPTNDNSTPDSSVPKPQEPNTNEIPSTNVQPNPASSDQWQSPQQFTGDPKASANNGTNADTTSNHTGKNVGNWEEIEEGRFGGLSRVSIAQDDTDSVISF